MKRVQPPSEIPTSPMADIAFLLVIYFMVTITFAATQGLDYGLPDDQAPAVVDPVASVLIEVLPDATLLVDGDPSSIDDLWHLLAPKLEREPGKPVLLRAREGAVYGSVVTTYDRLRNVPVGLDLKKPLEIHMPTEREIEQMWS